MVDRPQAERPHRTRNPRAPRWPFYGLLGALLLPALVVAWVQSWPSAPPDRSVAAQPASDADHEHTNRLTDETSPYLQQHAHNPVDWYPWGEEAFAKAREQDKPIFLSVGYSTCYWCHVMEKESFEDEEVAALLNEHFVAIKVDREERPDVDEQYMMATQIITRRGGWPNSVWLTPDGRPWMAGTYFPKPQFMQLLNNLAEAWETSRDEIDAQADQLAQVIAQIGSGAAIGPTQAEVGPELFNNAIEALTESYDERYGGFGQAPKFPPHGVLRALMRQYERTGDEELLDTVVQTLDAMWLGGMHDHVGGGFHRYATDREWLLPHFEKMLYDNAQLLHNYAEAYALTNEPRFRRVADDIVGWVRREMTHERGGFYSAIDSGEVGEEGEAYVWHYREILDVLGEDDGQLVMELYNVEEAGNFREEATGERPGTNILHLSQPLEEDAAQRGQDAKAWHARLENLREKLLAKRDTWPQPHKDDKILASWNGLMIGALAHAGRLLEEPAYTQTARDAADFILDEMVQPDGTLLRVYREGEAKQPGFLDDYAYFTEALLELYEATGESHWLEHAQTLGDLMIDQFYDQANGGFFYTSDQSDALLVRSKGLSGGGNIPAPNGVAAQALLRLASYTDEGHYRESAERTVRSLAGTIANSPHAAESLLLAAFALEDERATPERNPIEAAGTQKEPLSDTETGNASSISDDMLRNPDAEASFSAVHARAFASRLNIQPGETMHVVVVLDIDEGWHLYGHNPNLAFLVPTEVSVKSDDALNPGEVGAPTPQAKEDPFVGQVVNTYEGRIWYSVAVEVDPAAPDGTSSVEIKLRVQACDANRCLPPEDTTLSLPIRIDDDASSSERHRDLMQVVKQSHGR